MILCVTFSARSTCSIVALARLRARNSLMTKTVGSNNGMPVRASNSSGKRSPDSKTVFLTV